MAVYERVGETDLLSDRAHLVFIKIFQRLDDEPARDERLDPVDAVVVGLDDLGVLRAARLDDVRVQGALAEEPFGLVELEPGDDLVPHRDEGLADGFAFFLRIGKAGDGLEEGLARVLDDKVREAELAVALGDHRALVLAHEAVVDVEPEHAVLAKGLVEEREGDRGVDAA